VGTFYFYFRQGLFVHLFEGGRLPAQAIDRLISRSSFPAQLEAAVRAYVNVAFYDAVVQLLLVGGIGSAPSLASGEPTIGKAGAGLAANAGGSTERKQIDAEHAATKRWSARFDGSSTTCCLAQAEQDGQRPCAIWYSSACGRWAIYAPDS
jgi:hypothetical protein